MKRRLRRYDRFGEGDHATSGSRWGERTREPRCHAKTARRYARPTLLRHCEQSEAISPDFESVREERLPRRFAPRNDGIGGLATAYSNDLTSARGYACPTLRGSYS